MAEPQKNPDDNVIDIESFRRAPLDAKRWNRPLSDYITFRNAVAVVAAAAFLIFLGSAVSARIAFLFAGLLALLAIFLVEASSRRAWEAGVIHQLQRMAGDYERLVRETARNRNDLTVLKQSLADAGALARNQSSTPGEGLEQRMIRTLADQLSRLGDTDAPELTEDLSAFEMGAIEVDSPLMQASQEEIARVITDEQVLRLVNAAVKQDRIDLFLQPIVALPQRKLRFYEMFSRIRIRPDVYLPAERYIEVAMRQDLVPALDNLLLLRGLQLIREVNEGDGGGAFFCNITSITLNDPKFMGDLVEFIAQNRGLAPRLVFELGQRDLAMMSPDVLPILDGLSRLGCRFSMDQVRSLSFDFTHMEARRIRFVKADAPLVLREMKEKGGMARLKRLKAEMDSNGIDFIVTKIEGERELLELLDLGIDYGQGYLFGRPAPRRMMLPGKA